MSTGGANAPSQTAAHLTLLEERPEYAPRSSYAERLAKLGGQIAGLGLTPGTHSGTAELHDAHALAMSLAFARRGPRDIGPEIVVALYCGFDGWRPRIVAELASALLQTSKLAQRHEAHIVAISRCAYESAVFGSQFKPPKGCHPGPYRALLRDATAVLWNAANNTLSHAARAYYGA